MRGLFLLRQRRDEPRETGDLLEGRLLRDSYYAQRFFSPRLSATHLNRRHLRTTGRVLSLCPGHGVFEFSLQLAAQKPATLVSMDAQFINLLVLKHLLGVEGSLICHDLQFRLPFEDGWFDGVFSSTCLPEMPTQRQFACEAIRVTAPSGWTLFDSVWALDSGVKRIDPERHYRFCQNFFERLRDYVPFFRECAGPTRLAAFDISGRAGDYFGGPPWLSGVEADAAFANPRDVVMSVLVTDPQSFEGFQSESEPVWLRADILSVSPAYVMERRGERITLTRKREFAHPQIYFTAPNADGLPPHVDLALASLHDPVQMKALYAAGIAVALPTKLMRRAKTFADLTAS
jgi:SAM-dependent methyltransferase